MPISDFLNIVKESNYNISEIFSQAPTESMIVLLIVIAIILGLYFYIQRNIKISNAIKLVENIQDVKTLEEYNEQINKLVAELPKRGEKVAQVLDAVKEHLLLRSSKLLSSLDISQKIEKYLEMSKTYKELATGSKKYKNEKLTTFYETKSTELLEINLHEEIIYYIQNVNIDENEVKNINAIVKYANDTKNPFLILDEMFKNLNRYSFSYNLDLYKFIKKLDKENSKQLFTYCNDKLKALFDDTDAEISIFILEYILKEDKETVYNYISKLTNATYLQQLYNQLFNKKDDLHLDLAFIANPTKIENQYKKYIDESLTNNWRDSEHIELVSKAPGVLEVLGHMEFRTLIERIDNLGIESENRKMVKEALTIAKRAESIALEAKALNKRPITTPIEKSE